MKHLFKLFILSVLFVASIKADTSTDLLSLNANATILNTTVSNLSMDQDGACMSIGSFNTAIEDFIVTIENITANLSTFSVTSGDLDSLDSLSAWVKNIALESVRLSIELNSIETMADLFEYQAALSAMLQLSSDIGTMADRILEMADRILVMADNIGLMADRILVTQTLQSANLALTQGSILTTQQNLVALSDSFSSIAYNLSLGLIVDDSNTLGTYMGSTPLTNLNMADELTTLSTMTSSTLTKVTDLLLWMTTQSSKASHYINADTLTMLGDLTVIHKSLGLSLENYANTVNTLAPLTDTVILSDATASMLQLTKDIGVMSDRIMEMADKIFIMADNIGLMADNIVTTQNIQMANVTLTQNSLMTSQTLMITLIKNFGL